MKSSSRAGFTLVEAMMGVALAAIVGLVLAGIFKAGLDTYNYTMRQSLVLTSYRKAAAGDGPRRGMVWSAQDAVSVAALTASTLTVNPSAGAALNYTVTGEKLWRSQAGTFQVQAPAVTGLQVNYYNLDAAGLVIESTAAASALMATTLTTLQATGKYKTYVFFSGGLLRNHP